METEEDKVTNTLAEIALNEAEVGSYFLTDEQLIWLTFEGISDLAEKLNHRAVEKQLNVDITATSTGLLISWRPLKKNARNS